MKKILFAIIALFIAVSSFAEEKAYIVTVTTINRYYFYENEYKDNYLGMSDETGNTMTLEVLAETKALAEQAAYSECQNMCYSKGERYVGKKLYKEKRVTAHAFVQVLPQTTKAVLRN